MLLWQLKNETLTERRSSSDGHVSPWQQQPRLMGKGPKTRGRRGALTCAGGALGFAGGVVVREAAADDASRSERRAGVRVQLREAIFTSSAALRFRHYRHLKKKKKKITLLWLRAVYLNFKARLELLWSCENGIKESSPEEREHLSKGSGRIPDGCDAAKFLKIRNGIRRNTDGSCSRSPSCRLCPGWTPEVRALLSGPPLWKVSCNPDLTGLLRETDGIKTKREVTAEVWYQTSTTQKDAVRECNVRNIKP